MAWPTVAVNVTNLDANADSPLSARSDILDLTTKFNDLIAMRAVANGVASLDAAGKVPGAQVNAADSLVIGAPIGGDKGAGTLNLDSDLYRDGVNITTPAAVTNFLRGHAVYFTAGHYATYASHDVFAYGAYTSLGPTGSGAAIIWTALDVLPSTAKAVIAMVDTYIYGSTSGTAYGAEVLVRATGAGNSTNSFAARAAFINRSGSQEQDSNVVQCVIPLDSSRRFDVYTNKTGAGYSGQAVLRLIGWIDSLI